MRSETRLKAIVICASVVIFVTVCTQAANLDTINIATILRIPVTADGISTYSVSTTGLTQKLMVCHI
jgi:hypothetical protein